jgi:hypothetical protein
MMFVTPTKFALLALNTPEMSATLQSTVSDQAFGTKRTRSESPLMESTGVQKKKARPGSRTSRPLQYKMADLNSHPNAKAVINDAHFLVRSSMVTDDPFIGSVAERRTKAAEFYSQAADNRSIDQKPEIPREGLVCHQEQYETNVTYSTQKTTSCKPCMCANFHFISASAHNGKTGGGGIPLVRKSRQRMGDG